MPASNRIRIIGPRQLKEAQQAGERIVWTTSQSTQDWQQELSPFFLGPVPLYDGMRSKCMENAWQFSKVFATHADAEGNPTEAYWRWARDGWARSAVRYPMGKGVKPLYLLWDGQRLSYTQARRQVYWPLYRDAVAKTDGFARLRELVEEGPVSLFDFDGYDHEAMGMSLLQVANYTARPMGHAFVLKAMLLHGTGVSPEDLGELETAQPSQTELF